MSTWSWFDTLTCDRIEFHRQANIKTDPAPDVCCSAGFRRRLISRDVTSRLSAYQASSTRPQRIDYHCSILCSITCHLTHWDHSAWRPGLTNPCLESQKTAFRKWSAYGYLYLIQSHLLPSVTRWSGLQFWSVSIYNDQSILTFILTKNLKNVGYDIPLKLALHSIILWKVKCIWQCLLKFKVGINLDINGYINP